MLLCSPCEIVGYAVPRRRKRVWFVVVCKNIHSPEAWGKSLTHRRGTKHWLNSGNTATQIQLRNADWTLLLATYWTPNSYTASIFYSSCLTCSLCNSKDRGFRTSDALMTSRVIPSRKFCCWHNYFRRQYVHSLDTYYIIALRQLHRFRRRSVSFAKFLCVKQNE